jgi:hypothetical protein
LRADRDALGLKRKEVYVHPDDWTAIKTLAERLQRKRAKDRKTEAARKAAAKLSKEPKT